MSVMESTFEIIINYLPPADVVLQFIKQTKTTHVHIFINMYFNNIKRAAFSSQHVYVTSLIKVSLT